MREGVQVREITNDWAGPSRKPNPYRHWRPPAGLVEEKQELVSRKGGSVDSPGGGGPCGTLWR